MSDIRHTPEPGVMEPEESTSSEPALDFSQEQRVPSMPVLISQPERSGLYTTPPKPGMESETSYGLKYEGLRLSDQAIVVKVWGKLLRDIGMQSIESARLQGDQEDSALVDAVTSDAAYLTDTMNFSAAGLNGHAAHTDRKSVV